MQIIFLTLPNPFLTVYHIGSQQSRLSEMFQLKVLFLFIDFIFLINDILSLIYAIEVSQDVKVFLKSILLSGQTTDSYWTGAWNTYKSNTTIAANRTIVLTRLQAMFKYLMNLPEYQLS